MLEKLQMLEEELCLEEGLVMGSLLQFLLEVIQHLVLVLDLGLHENMLKKMQKKALFQIQ